MASSVGFKSSPVVLQGEFSVLQYQGSVKKIITSMPTACIVLTLHNQIRQVGVLAHFDLDTSVPDVLTKIEKICRERLNLTLNASHFSAKVMGGAATPIESIFQKKRVVKALKQAGLDPEEVFLSEDPEERPQIHLDICTGKISFLAKELMNRSLEYLQRREYGEFMKDVMPSLIFKYGRDIFCEGKEASREIEEIQEISMTSIEEERARWFDEERVKLLSLIKKDRVEAPEETSEFRQGVMQSVGLDLNDYHSCLRQAAKTNQLASLRFLLENRFYLGVSVYARGEASETALDAATKEGHEEAIGLLQPYYN